MNYDQTIRCTGCNATIKSGYYAESSKQAARREGWSKIYQIGWLCPVCLQEQNDKDLKTLTAFCDLLPESSTKTRLYNRMIRTLAYRDVHMRITKNEKEFLREKLNYPDLDPEIEHAVRRAVNSPCF